MLFLYITHLHLILIKLLIVYKKNKFYIKNQLDLIQMRPLTFAAPLATAYFANGIVRMDCYNNGL